MRLNKGSQMDISMTLVVSLLDASDKYVGHNIVNATQNLHGTYNDSSEC